MDCFKDYLKSSDNVLLPEDSLAFGIQHGVSMTNVSRKSTF